MISTTMCLPALSRKSVALGIRVLALAGGAVAGTASARSAYDGDWSVVITTSGGACEPSVRYGVQIENGKVVAGNGQATVQGRVSPTGAVRVTVQAGDQWAEGSGRLGREQGGGIWNGQGSAGMCQGRWVAQRSETVGEEGRRPIYNYAPPSVVRGVEDAGRAIAACEARFRSYNPATETYLRSDGARHRCP